MARQPNRSAVARGATPDRRAELRALREDRVRRLLARPRHGNVEDPADAISESVASTPVRQADGQVAGAGLWRRAAVPGPRDASVTFRTTRQEAEEGTVHSGDPALRLDTLPGAGPGIVWALTQCGIRDLADLAAADTARLRAALGLFGVMLPLADWQACAAARLRRAMP